MVFLPLALGASGVTVGIVEFWGVVEPAVADGWVLGVVVVVVGVLGTVVVVVL